MSKSTSLADLPDTFDCSSEGAVRELMQHPLEPPSSEYCANLSPNELLQVAQLEVLLWVAFTSKVDKSIEVSAVEAGRSRYFDDACKIITEYSGDERENVISAVLTCCRRAGRLAKILAHEKSVISTEVYIEACDNTEDAFTLSADQTAFACLCETQCMRKMEAAKKKEDGECES